MNNNPNYIGKQVPQQQPIPQNNAIPIPPQPVNLNQAQPSVNPVGSPTNNMAQMQNTYNNSSINDLNVDGAYNRMNVAPDYVNDSKVKENMEAPKKNTVPISKELKTVFIIAAILLVFIIIMPIIFDYINNLRFH